MYLGCGCHKSARKQSRLLFTPGPPLKRSFCSIPPYRRSDSVLREKLERMNVYVVGIQGTDSRIVGKKRLALICM